MTITANVTSASDWKKLVETAEDKFGGLDILVNNAGTSYKNKSTLEVTEDEFDKVMAVNVKSIYHSVPATVPSFRKRGGGSIINIASIGAMRPRPGLVWYNASKGAVANVSLPQASVHPDTPPLCATLLLTSLSGNKRSRGRVRQRQHPRQCALPTAIWYRSV